MSESYSYRYLVTQPHLNAHGSLHGGSLMRWVDEACGMQARLITGSVCATRYIGEINFISSAHLGDIVQIKVTTLKVGKTSIQFEATVESARTQTPIAHFNQMVFVSIDNKGKPQEIKC